MADPSPRLFDAFRPDDRSSAPSKEPTGVLAGSYGAADKRQGFDEAGAAEGALAGGGGLGQILSDLGMRFIGPMNMAMFLFTPWAVFALVMLPFALGYRRLAPLAWIVFAIFMIFSFGLIWWSTRPRGTPRLYWRMLGTMCFFMTVLATLLGLLDYYKYIDSYRTYQNSRTYSDVLPEEDPGAFQDAGAITFGQGTVVDASRAISYKDRISYCVAPIIKEEVGALPQAEHGYLPKVSFWAVGEDCCKEGHKFWCGPIGHGKAALGGHVVLDSSPLFDSGRPQYIKAVKKAAAQYDFYVPDAVIMVKWTADPSEIVDHFWDEGVAFYRRAVGYFALISLVLLLLFLAKTHKVAFMTTAGRLKRMRADAHRNPAHV